MFYSSIFFSEKKFTISIYNIKFFEKCLINYFIFVEKQSSNFIYYFKTLVNALFNYIKKNTDLLIKLFNYLLIYFLKKNYICNFNTNNLKLIIFHKN